MWQWPQLADTALPPLPLDKLSSQIDFVITKQAAATAAARKAGTGTLQNFPVAGWRDGAKRHPVEAMIPIPTYRWHATPKRPTSQIDTAQIIADLNSKQAQTSLQSFRDEIAAQVSQDLDDMEKVVLQAALTHYLRKRPSTQVPTQPQQLANCARHMWQLFPECVAEGFPF